MSRIKDLLLGVLSLAITLGLLIGVPALLVLLVGNPFPDMIRGATGDLVSQSERIRLLLVGGLTLLCWTAWVQVAFAIVAETLAMSKGRMANQAPIMPGLQMAAGKLVASTALIITALTPSANVGQTLAPLQAVDVGTGADSVATASYEGESNMGAEGGTTASAEVPTSSQLYEVAAGDTFWSVAERTLGDGLRWSEIRDLNQGALMDDGSTIGAGTEVLRAGWKLAMPTDAVIPSPGASTSAPAPGLVAGAQPDSVDVEQGDHFWSIAEELLTDAWGRQPSDAEITPFWAQLVAANDANLLPPEDPDLIYPGQQFDVPDVPVDPLNPDAPMYAEAAPAPVPQSVGDPKTHTPPREQHVPPGIAIGGSETPAPATVAESAAADADTPLGLGQVVLLSSGLALLSAGILQLVERLRDRRLGERSPGTAPAFNPPPAAEALVRRHADEGALLEIGDALRALAPSAEADTQPAVVGMAVDNDRIEVLLAEPSMAAPHPFTPAYEGTRWFLDRNLDFTPDPTVANPLPLLATVGHTDEAELLLELEQAGVVQVNGTPDDARATMATMALNLATTPLADAVDIICIGFGEELANFERITVVDTYAQAQSRVVGHAIDTARLVADAGVTAMSGRARNIAGDSWTPLVVFSADTNPDDGAALVRAAEQSFGAGVTAVVVTAPHSHWSIDVVGDNVSVPRLGLAAQRRNLTTPELDQVAQLVEDARNPESRPVADLLAMIAAVPAPSETTSGSDTAADTEAARNATTGPLPTDHPALPEFDPNNDATVIVPTRTIWGLDVADADDSANFDYRVDVLGDLRVMNVDGDTIEFDRVLCAEFLGYLVTHRPSSDDAAIQAALWPNHDHSRPLTNAIVSSARDALGDDSAGEPYVAKVGADSLYRVSAAVGSDLDVFTTNVRRAATCAPIPAVEHLRIALELVRGVPFSGPGLAWAQVEGLAPRVAISIDEAARTMATLALEQLDRPDDAAWATERGLLANPRSSELHLLRLRTAIARPDNDLDPESVFQSYRTVMMADDDQPEGHSHLDDRIVDLYESYRRTQPTQQAPVS